MHSTGRWLCVLVATTLASCGTAMTMTVVSRGPTLTVTASCGDQQFRDTLTAAREVVWRSSANSCTISTGEASGEASGSTTGTGEAQASRDLTITTICQHDHSCGFRVVGEVDAPSLRAGQQVVVEVRGDAVVRQP